MVPHVDIPFELLSVSDAVSATNFSLAKRFVALSAGASASQIGPGSGPGKAP